MNISSMVIEGGKRFMIIIFAKIKDAIMIYNYMFSIFLKQSNNQP